MTTFVYSVFSFLMIIMGVIAFDHWGNTVNIPDDKSEEIQENSLFPVRHIRNRPKDPLCECISETKPLEFGATYHPSRLVSNDCAEPQCVDQRKCREVDYYLNVSSFKYPNRQRTMCPGEWEWEVRRISVACVPIQQPIRVTKAY